MSTTMIAFFNNKGGVGKTSLVYHMAWMVADLGIRVVAADLDPQANLSAAFLDEDRLEELWPEGDHPNTVYGCVQPLLRGAGDIADPHLEYIEDQLALLVGDMSLLAFDDELSIQWPGCMDGKRYSFRVTSAFWRIMQRAAETYNSDVILIDLGPNLGAINRAALIASDYVVVPLSPDLFCLQGLRYLGFKLKQWRQEWKERLDKNPLSEMKLPTGRMEPVGYIVLQPFGRLDRPIRAYHQWIARIPEVYRTAVLNENEDRGISVTNDPYCLTILKHYGSLIPLAQEARKPVFYLKPADGAIGAYVKAIQSAYSDFRKLAKEIANRTEISLP